MKFKLLDFVPEHRENKKIVGHIQVGINDSFVCWLVVLHSDTNGYFFKAPTLFLEDKFEETFSFLKENVIQKINRELLPEFKKKNV